MRADVVMPTAHDGAALSVDGETVEIVRAMGLPNRRTLFVSALNAVFGEVPTFSGVHVWTAELDRSAARAPSLVVPGHLVVEAATDASALAFTRGDLLAFEEALAAGGDAAAPKAAMQARCPGLGMEVALDIGAKVATGEMVWG